VRLAIVVSLCACLLAIAGSAVWVAASISRVAGATESAELLAAASLQSTAATLRETRQTLDLLPGESVAWRATIQGLAQPVSRQAVDLLAHADVALNGNTIPQIGNTIAGLRTDLKPVLENAATAAAAARPALDNAAALTKDLRDSWDDSYWDVKAGLESATVAARSVAEASGTIERALPAAVATGQETNRQIAGIASDVHTATTQFVKPKTVKEKVWGVFQIVIYGLAHAL